MSSAVTVDSVNAMSPVGSDSVKLLSIILDRFTREKGVVSIISLVETTITPSVKFRVAVSIVGGIISAISVIAISRLSKLSFKPIS